MCLGGVTLGLYPPLAVTGGQVGSDREGVL